MSVRSANDVIFKLHYPEILKLFQFPNGSESNSQNILFRLDSFDITLTLLGGTSSIHRTFMAEPVNFFIGWDHFHT